MPDYTALGSDDVLVHTNGYEGEVISRLLRNFVARTDSSKTISKVRFVGIQYPALPVLPELNNSSAPLEQASANSMILMSHLMTYDNSYRVGAKMTADFIKQDERRGCNTQYMLLSYSQGVIAARLAANLLDNNTDKIINSYVIGDPFQKAGGASSTRQKTVANTSPDTLGVGRYATNAINGISAGNVLNPILAPVSIAALVGVNNYTNEITKADPVIYRDDGPNGVVSRVVCHTNDPTCGFNPLHFDINRHTSYFDPEIPEGQVDLDYEVSEFDKQVQTLANSISSNPRERVLTKTPSITGQETTYNVANARSDDHCAWDVGSDGSVDSSGLCDTFTVSEESANPKMSVKVTDSFGIVHNLSTESEAIDSEAVADILNLDPNGWYQFQPHDSPAGWDDMHRWGHEKACVDRWHPYSSQIDNFPNYFRYSECHDFTNDHYAYNTGQVAKPSDYVVDGKKQTRMLWGYDDSYSWDASDSYQPKVSPTSADDTQNIKPIFTKLENGVPYYRIVNKGEVVGGIPIRDDLCLTSMDITSVGFMPCEEEDSSQLFSASKVDGHFGDFSIERDVTAPTAVTGLNVTVGSDAVQLHWDYSTDGRASYVDYDVYLKNNATGDFSKVGSIGGDVSYDLGSDGLTVGSEYTYKVVAVDFAGNQSTAGLLTFTMPELKATPNMATVAAVNPDDGTISIVFDKSSYPNANVRVWNYWDYQDIGNTDSYILHESYPGEYFYVTYQFEVSPNVFTEQAEYLDTYIEREAPVE